MCGFIKTWKKHPTQEIKKKNRLIQAVGRRNHKTKPNLNELKIKAL